MSREYLVVEYLKTRGIGKVVKKFTCKVKALEFALEQYQKHKDVADSDYEVEEST